MTQEGYMVNGGPLNGVYVGNGLNPGNYGEDEWHIFNSYTNGAKVQYDDPCEDQSQPAERHLYLSNSDGLAWSSDPLPLSSACSNDNDDPAEDPASTSDAIIELVMRMVVLVKLQQSSASGSAAHPTADTPFDSPVLAPADYIDDLVTPATTPDSDRSVSPPSEKASPRCLSPDSPPTNQPNANRISTVVQEEEPASSAPQVKDSVDELTAQSAEEPSSAATTTPSGPGAGQSTIDKATHGLETGNSAFRRAPAIDASSQEADGSTKIGLYESSGKIIPKNGPTNKRARDEEDDDTNEPTSMTNKKVKTTNVTNDTEAGPASTFGNATSTNGSTGQIPTTANGLGAYDVDAGEMPAQELVLDGLASGLAQASDTFVPTVGPTAAPPSASSALAKNPYLPLTDPVNYVYPAYAPPQPQLYYSTSMTFPATPYGAGPYMGLYGMSSFVPLPLVPPSAPKAKCATTSTQKKEKRKTAKKDKTAKAAAGTSSSQGANAGKAMAPATTLNEAPAAAGPSSSTGGRQSARRPARTTSNAAPTAGASRSLDWVNGGHMQGLPPPPKTPTKKNKQPKTQPPKAPTFLTPGKKSKNERNRANYLPIPDHPSPHRN